MNGDGATGGTDQSDASRGPTEDPTARMVSQLSEELERVRRQLDALMEENRRLRNQEPREEGPTPITPQVNVTVHPPIAASRLGVFTGQKATGGSEVDFKEWEQRVLQLTRECSGPEVLQRVRGSLRALAWEQVKSCSSVDDILHKLRGVYDDIHTSEDRYLDFVQTKMDRKETPSGFLTRLWEKFYNLNRDNTYTDSEGMKKIYHAFITNVKAMEPLLALEVRNTFGQPGSTSPDVTEVLKLVKRLESTPSPAPRTAQSQVHHTSNQDIDLDKLAEKVAEKLRPNPAFRASRTKPSGPCYRCGVVGQHFARDCRNSPNPGRVTLEKERAKRPLNGFQSQAAGSQ